MANYKPEKYLDIPCQAVGALTTMNMYGQPSIEVRVVSGSGDYQFDSFEATHRLPMTYGPMVNHWIKENTPLVATIKVEYSYMADGGFFVGGEVCDLVLDKT